MIITKKYIDTLILETIDQNINYKKTKTFPIFINDEEFECVQIHNDINKEKGTNGYIVYDKFANEIGKFDYVRSLEELEYLVEKKLNNLATKEIKTPTDLDTIRRRKIINPFVPM